MNIWRNRRHWPNWWRGLCRRHNSQLWQAAGEGDAVEVDPAVIALLDARLADYAANPNAVSPWKEVEERVFERHGA